MKSASRDHIIRARKQLKALTSSARQEIIDALSQIGTVSVAELAATLARPPDALYYHLRALNRAGLVVQGGYRHRGMRQEKLFRAVAPELQLRYVLGPQGNGHEIVAIVSSMLRLGIRDFRQSYLRGDASVCGPDRELWALRKTGWLGRQEIIRVNQFIERLLRTASKPTGKGRLYALTVLLTPLHHRGRAARIDRSPQRRTK
jgi:DNA-binding transcriptional ArsR family regulator